MVIAAGALALAAGLRLAVETIRLFAWVGEGTLAPWDPTLQLVVVGPYRRVRNPMITGVGLVLLGQGLVLGSVAILIEFAAFATINVTWLRRPSRSRGSSGASAGLCRIQAGSLAVDPAPGAVDARSS